LDEAGRIKIVAGVDIVVAVLLLIAGLLIIILGLDYVNMMSTYSEYPGYNPFTAAGMYPWIILVFGIATVVYGIKRMIDNILKIITAGS